MLLPGGIFPRAKMQTSHPVLAKQVNSDVWVSKVF